jgi:hypothetical protein
MAIDQKEIALAMCKKVVKNASIILDALDELEATQEQIVGSNIDLATYVADIETNLSIKHCDVNTYKNILSAFGPGIVAAMKALYDGTPTQQGWVALQKARFSPTGIPEIF